MPNSGLRCKISVKGFFRDIVFSEKIDDIEHLPAVALGLIAPCPDQRSDIKDCALRSSNKL
jgi:hypothetical protein